MLKHVPWTSSGPTYTVIKPVLGFHDANRDLVRNSHGWKESFTWKRLQWLKTCNMQPVFLWTEQWAWQPTALECLAIAAISNLLYIYVVWFHFIIKQPLHNTCSCIFAKKNKSVLSQQKEKFIFNQWLLYLPSHPSASFFCTITLANLTKSCKNLTSYNGNWLSESQYTCLGCNGCIFSCRQPACFQLGLIDWSKVVMAAGSLDCSDGFRMCYQPCPAGVKNHWLKHGAEWFGRCELDHSKGYCGVRMWLLLVWCKLTLAARSLIVPPVPSRLLSPLCCVVAHSNIISPCGLSLWHLLSFICSWWAARKSMLLITSAKGCETTFWHVVYMCDKL